MKVITLVPDVFDHVKIMLKDYVYADIFLNYTIILGYNGENDHDRLSVIIQDEKNLERIVVCYQLEQLYKGRTWGLPEFISKLKLFDEIWDYDKNNIEYLKSEHGIFAQHMPLFYSNKLRNPIIYKSDDQSIDILFYGWINARRQEILNDIRAKNPDKNIVVLENVYGSILDTYIAQSKIILNLHYYPICIQEQVRMFYPVINNKCVVSEYSIRNYFGNSIEQVHKNLIGLRCKEILDSNIWRIMADESAEIYKNLTHPIAIITI